MRLAETFISLVEPSHLWALFGVALIYAATMSWIFIYHWREFGTGTAVIFFAEAVYCLVTILIFGGLIGFITLFSAL